MKDSIDILSSLLKTTQMGQVGIRSVMDAANSTELKKALNDQLKEYDAIEKETYALAQERNFTLQGLNGTVRSMTDMITRSQLMYRKSDSKIAAMMVHGNTRGVVKGLKNLHRYHQNDGAITALAQRLMDCENNNILEMEGFL